jgi:hypothetical protein
MSDSMLTPYGTHVISEGALEVVRNVLDWSVGVIEDRRAGMALGMAAREVKRIVETSEGPHAAYKALRGQVAEWRGMIARAKHNDTEPRGLVQAVEMLRLLGVE